MEKAEAGCDQVGGANKIMAARDRTWAECGLEQKVERVRDALLRVERILDATHKRANDALRTAKGHDHNAAGEVMVPAAEKYVPTLEEMHFDLRHIFSGLR